MPRLGPEEAEPKARELLERAKKQLGMIPNMYGAMANASETLDTYLYGYERFRKESGFTPAEQEVVFLTISHENGCEYCMAAHSTIADTRSGVPRAATDAIRAGAGIDDPRLRALSDFTRAMLRKRGRLDQEDVDSFLEAGFSEKQVLDVVLAIAVKTISNYTNHIFDTPVDAPFMGRAWKPTDPAPRTRAQAADAQVR